MYILRIRSTDTRTKLSRFVKYNAVKMKTLVYEKITNLFLYSFRIHVGIQ